MTMQPYLCFSNIQTNTTILAWCSACDHGFVARRTVVDPTADLIVRLRAEFEAHDCPKASKQEAA